MAFNGSVVSYPNRGKWGNNKWRGNTTGWIVKDFIESYTRGKANPLFVDPAVGGGTSKDVARDLGIECVCLDLHSDFNLLRDSLLDRLPREADLLHFHPPYANMITYAGNVWGNAPHPDDLGNNSSIGEFFEKSMVALNNIFDAMAPGGYYSVLIGNWRQNGTYYNLSSGIERIAPGSLVDEIIKIQHNCTSDQRQYGGNFVPIRHEKMLVFRKDTKVLCALDFAALQEEKARRTTEMTWRAALRTVMLGKGPMTLTEIYTALEDYAISRGTNNNWNAKVRQRLRKDSDFERIARGTYVYGQMAA